MWNMKELNKLCKQYGYKNQEYFDGIQIITPSDWWVIKYKSDKRIELYHANKRFRTGYHYQRHFNNGLNKVFAYINEHEQKPFRMNDKLFRIKELLNTVL